MPTAMSVSKKEIPVLQSSDRAGVHEELPKLCVKIVTQMLGNIPVQKSASSDTRTWGFLMLLC